MADTYSTISPFLVIGGTYNAPVGGFTDAYADLWDFVWQAAAANLSGYQQNAAIDTGYYMPYARDYGTYNRSDLHQSLAWWQANHPDWVLYSSDQVTPAWNYDTTYVPLDATNPNVVAWQIANQAVGAKAAGYTYLAADNLSMKNYSAYGRSAVGVYKSGVWTPLYTGSQLDATYRASLATWCSTIWPQLQTIGMKLAINLFPGGGVSFTDSSVISAMQNCDAVLDEQGFTAVGNVNDTGTDWLARVAWHTAIQQTYSKSLKLMNVLLDSSTESIQYCMASYLMGKYHHSSLCVFPPGDTIDNENFYIDQYTSLNTIGTPLEDMTLDGSVYRRTFSGGIVLCNPDAVNTYTYTYNGRTYTLTPTSGLVVTNTKYGGF